MNPTMDRIQFTNPDPFVFRYHSGFVPLVPFSVWFHICTFRSPHSIFDLIPDPLFLRYESGFVPFVFRIFLGYDSGFVYVSLVYFHFLLRYDSGFIQCGPFAPDSYQILDVLFALISFLFFSFFYSKEAKPGNLGTSESVAFYFQIFPD